MTLSDGMLNSQYVLMVRFLKRQLKVFHNSSLLVFPMSPFNLWSTLNASGYSYGTNLIYIIKSAPSHGVVRPSHSGNITKDVRQLVYISDDVRAELCWDIGSSSISDRIVLTVADDKLSSQTDVTLNFNISYLNIHENSASALRLETSELRVPPGQSMVISVAEINATELAKRFAACKSNLRIGFRLTQHPKYCKIIGLLSDDILWWHKLRSLEYSCACQRFIFQSEHFSFNVVVQQNDILHALDQINFTVAIRLDGWTQPCNIYLLQGHDSVILSTSVIECLSMSADSNFLLALKHSPMHGILTVHGIELKNKPFTLDDIIGENVVYQQKNLSKVDQFELTVKVGDSGYMKPLAVIVEVEPNIVSREPVVVTITQGVIVLTTELLDASPLLSFSNGHPIFHVTRQPVFGRLEKVADRGRRATGESETLTSFSQTDIVNEVILYYSPDEMPIEGKDNFTYTLVSDGVQPADGLFSVVFNKSVESPVASALDEPILDNLETNELILTGVVVASCVFICILSIIITVLCLRRTQRSRRKHVAQRTPSHTEQRLILTKENGSYKLLVAGSDEFAITPYSMPPSPSRQIDPDKEREVSCTIPQVRVTPLLDKDNTAYDLHDYVNCEDLPYHTPVSSPSTARSVAGSNYSYQTSGQHVSETTVTVEDKFYSSIERLPPIKKPSYSC